MYVYMLYTNSMCIRNNFNQLINIILTAHTYHCYYNYYRYHYYCHTEPAQARRLWHLQRGEGRGKSLPVYTRIHTMTYTHNTVTYIHNITTCVHECYGYYSVLYIYIYIYASKLMRWLCYVSYTCMLGHSGWVHAVLWGGHRPDPTGAYTCTHILISIVITYA